MEQQHYSELDVAVLELSEAKKAEAEAKDKRIAAEEKVTAFVDTGDKQSKTVHTGVGFDVIVTRGMIHKGDVEKIRQLDMEGLPVKRVPAEWVFDAKAYEAMEKKNKGKFAAFVETKPKKVSVTLKEK